MINKNFLITDKNGSVLQQLNYNLWGKRSVEAGSVYALPLFDRGFTGHEHLDMFGLINMNGRLYDPVVGRFFSPDNFVQGEGTQGFNRYSYCLNNPLKYTDPSGWYSLADFKYDLKKFGKDVVKTVVVVVVFIAYGIGMAIAYSLNPQIGGMYVVVGAVVGVKIIGVAFDWINTW